MAKRRRRRSTSSRRLVILLMIAVAAALAFLFLKPRLASHPQDFPWTEISLADPVGLFTSAKLAQLGDDRDQCLAMLDQANIRYSEMAAKGSDACLVPDAVRPQKSDSFAIDYRPQGIAPSCPVVSGLALWERDILNLAAEAHFGAGVTVTQIEHIGVYNCRRIAGSLAQWSQHATADAIDIAGFTLSNGERISVLNDWAGDTPKARFLHDARDGACDIFTTTLSPDYNAAHANHFHIDMADRGLFMPSLCR